MCRSPQDVNSCKNSDFLMFLPFRESGRIPDPALPRDCSKGLRRHPRRLGSETLPLLQRWGKQYWKRYLNHRYYNKNSQVFTIFWTSLKVNSRNGAVFLILFTFQESWRTSDPVLSRDCGSRLQLHPWCLSSEALQLLQRWGLLWK